MESCGGFDLPTRNSPVRFHASSRLFSAFLVRAPGFVCRRFLRLLGMRENFVSKVELS